MRGAYNQNDNSGYCMAGIIKSIPLWKSYLKATFCLIFVIIVQERAGHQAARETKVPWWFINQACPDSPSCPVKGLCWAWREESTTQNGIKIHTGASAHLQSRRMQIRAHKGHSCVFNSSLPTQPHGWGRWAEPASPHWPQDHGMLWAGRSLKDHLVPALCHG